MVRQESKWRRGGRVGGSKKVIHKRTTARSKVVFRDSTVTEWRKGSVFVDIPLYYVGAVIGCL